MFYKFWNDDAFNKASFLSMQILNHDRDSIINKLACGYTISRYIFRN